jgi:hypothetical protein
VVAKLAIPGTLILHNAMAKASTALISTIHLDLDSLLTPVNAILDTYGMVLTAPRLVATVILSKTQMALSAILHANVLMAFSGTETIAKSTVLVSTMLSGL